MKSAKLWAVSFALLGLACGCTTNVGVLYDFDGDGSLDADDCDTTNPDIHPGADDPFGDEIDQNCDGIDGIAVDQDGDGFSNAVDCDDEDPATYPGATDSEGDGIDQNCDGVDGVASTGDDDDPGGDDDDTSGDDDDTSGDDDSATGDDDDTASVDADADGVPASEDCDDLDASLGATSNDADCDGVLTAEDCDDGDASVYPGALEDWGDGIDQDCDGLADAAGAVCSADFTVDFPDGTSTVIDGCQTWSATSQFDYLASSPPDFVSLSLNLDSATSAGFDCKVTIEQSGICGLGYYDAADSNNHTTNYYLADCTGVGISYRQTYTATTGYLHLDTLDSGTAGGNFDGLTLATTVGGYLSVEDGSGVSLSGSFSLTLEQVVAPEVAAQACAVMNVDVDNDSFIDAYYGGDDCDDNDPSTVNDMDCDGVQTNLDCDDSDATMPLQDADCDGVLTTDDCDDSDPSLLTIAADTDCDGSLAIDDCDDSNALLYPADTNGDGTLDGCVWYVTYTGADQSFIVPTTVTSITAKLWGAGGGSPSGSCWTHETTRGGAGGFVEAIIPVTPLETLTLVTGAGGAMNQTTPRYGFGGYGNNAGGNHHCMGSTGGGLAGIFRGAVDQANALSIAGAGGGGSGAPYNSTNGGGAGGPVGENGWSAGAVNPLGGGGATVTGPGPAGAHSERSSGNPGGVLWGSVGLNGPDLQYTCGFGGAGYFGGGGGSWPNQGQGGGGGGGSNFVDPSATTTSNLGGSADVPPEQTNSDYMTDVGVGAQAGLGASNDQSGGDALIVIYY